MQAAIATIHEWLIRRHLLEFLLYIQKSIARQNKRNVTNHVMKSSFTNYVMRDATLLPVKVYTRSRPGHARHVVGLATLSVSRPPHQRQAPF